MPAAFKVNYYKSASGSRTSILLSRTALVREDLILNNSIIVCSNSPNFTHGTPCLFYTYRIVPLMYAFFEED